MKLGENKKTGISLIVLVITIIVMIILATAVVLTLSNSGIISKANDAVDATNIANVQDLASMLWADAYVGGARTQADLEDAVIEGLSNIENLDLDEYTVTVTEIGVTVEKTVPLTPGEKYYGDANIVPTNPEYFEYDYDTATMTATITGVKDTYKVIDYYVWGKNSDPYTTAIKAEDGTTITDVVIPYETIGEDEQTYIVTAIGEEAFYSGIPYKYSNYTSFVIPNSVTSIGTRAFYQCSALTSMTIPKSVTSIASEGIYSYQLEELYYDGKVQDWLKVELESNWYTGQIADKWYFDNELAENITIPNGVTTISDWAFSGCNSLISITIPNSVTSIGYRAFNNCSNLTSITIPSSVTSIDDFALNNCRSLTSITIPDSITSISDSVYRGCRSLESITIPSGVTSIGDYAFADCISLTSITIPSSVTSIGSSAFSNCSTLTSIAIPNGVERIKYGTFDRCKALTTITIPSSVTTIDNAVFSYCSSLTSITIPSSVTSIGNSVFSYCSNLTSITIPSGVTSIGSSAFYKCDSLTSAIFNNTSGWTVNRISIDVSDAANAATYLTSTYSGYSWTRSDE